MSWLQPALDVTQDREDCSEWAKTNTPYISRQDLLKLISGGKPGVLVVDVRDGDAIGGHIVGAVHFPDSTFTSRLRELSHLLEERHIHLVVFHCMESVRRGPRCAKRLYTYLKESNSQQVPIRVLQGGADRWIREYPAHTEDLDHEYWPASAESAEMHALYDPTKH
jgi:rhodanese-related sulfurtransferase